MKLKDEGLPLYIIAIVGILVMMFTYSQKNVDKPESSAVESEVNVHSDVSAELVPRTYQQMDNFEVSPELEKTFENEVRQCSMDLDEEEMNMLMKIAASETLNDDVKAMALVMRVVINRVLDSEFPNSIREVIYQYDGKYYQFSPAGDGTYDTAEINEKCHEALDLVLSGWDESQGATYFCSKENSYKWHDEALDELFEYGNHKFYK